MIQYPRPAIHRMVDSTIGSGRILAMVRWAGDEEDWPIEFTASGTFEDERLLAARVLRLVSAGGHGFRPVAAKLVHARGTWQEVPQWTDRWFGMTQ